jgi:biotin carboxyl carrier protein
MQYKVTVEDKTFTVEIEDINARPVVARVDGRKFEVTPENGTQHESLRDVRAMTSALPIENQKETTETLSDEMVAPLPGTVIEVFFKPGDLIEAGQVVLIIEAMKMKNSIRSTRSGKVAEILVNAGESVAHKQALMRFE